MPRRGSAAPAVPRRADQPGRRQPARRGRPRRGAPRAGRPGARRGAPVAGAATRTPSATSSASGRRGGRRRSSTTGSPTGSTSSWSPGSPTSATTPTTTPGPRSTPCSTSSPTTCCTTRPPRPGRSSSRSACSSTRRSWSPRPRCGTPAARPARRAGRPRRAAARARRRRELIGVRRRGCWTTTTLRRQAGPVRRRPRGLRGRALRRRADRRHHAHHRPLGRQGGRPQIELHVGRDLQFIRINGTIVGGLVGVADPRGPAGAADERSTDVREVPIRDESIRLGQFLKLADLVDNGADAKPLLAQARCSSTGRSRPGADGSSSRATWSASAGRARVSVAPRRLAT